MWYSHTQRNNRKKFSKQHGQNRSPGQMRRCSWVGSCKKEEMMGQKFHGKMQIKLGLFFCNSHLSVDENAQPNAHTHIQTWLKSWNQNTKIFFNGILMIIYIIKMTKVMQMLDIPHFWIGVSFWTLLSGKQLVFLLCDRFSEVHSWWGQPTTNSTMFLFIQVQ